VDVRQEAFGDSNRKMPIAMGADIIKLLSFIRSRHDAVSVTPEEP